MAEPSLTLGAWTGGVVAARANLELVLPTTGTEVLDLPMLPAQGGTKAARVHAGLRDAILGGRLLAGTRLPSSRALAAQMGVRRNTVIQAYEQLGSDGLVEGRLGSGTFVAARLPSSPIPLGSGDGPVGPPHPLPGSGPFAIGRTHPDPALLSQLGRLIRRSLVAPGLDPFGYGDARGSEALRRAIASHLAATRGIACDPRRILVTSGTQQAIRLMADVLLRPGQAVWMEDPGYPAARRCFEAAGARMVPVPVDGAGLDVAAGRARAPDAALAYVTPSHQFPTGVAMTMERRLALLDWARDAGAYVLEDDYDSEFRYAGPPLTALAGIDGNGRVIYLGTFSKTLFPGLRIGYAMLPPALLAPVAEARIAADRFPSTLGSDALTELIATGGFAAHVRRMRARYRAARDLLAAVLPQASGGLLQVQAPDQGLHLLALLPPGWPPGSAATIRSAASVEAWLLSDTRLEPAAPDGFVLGFSGHPLPELRQAADRLGRAVLRHAGDIKAET